MGDGFWHHYNRRRKPKPPGVVEDNLGPSIPPEFTLPPMTLHRPHDRFGASKIKAWPGAIIICIVLGVLFFIALAAASTRAKAADSAIVYPISIPDECVELATRERRPLVIENRTQALKAKAKLFTMNGKDPLVKQCREAVRTLEAAMKEIRK